MCCTSEDICRIPGAHHLGMENDEQHFCHNSYISREMLYQVHLMDRGEIELLEISMVRWKMLRRLAYKKKSPKVIRHRIWNITVPKSGFYEIYLKLLHFHCTMARYIWGVCM